MTRNPPPRRRESEARGALLEAAIAYGRVEHEHNPAFEDRALAAMLAYARAVTPKVTR